MKSCISWVLANWKAVSVTRVTYTVLALMTMFWAIIPEETGTLVQYEGLPGVGGVQV